MVEKSRSSIKEGNGPNIPTGQTRPAFADHTVPRERSDHSEIAGGVKSTRVKGWAVSFPTARTEGEIGETKFENREY